MRVPGEVFNLAISRRAEVRAGSSRVLAVRLGAQVRQLRVSRLHLGGVQPGKNAAAQPDLLVLIPLLVVAAQDNLVEA